MTAREPSGRELASATASAARITRGHSCLTCAQRKIRCDGQRPCSSCRKNGVECISKPARPSRSRRQHRHSADVPARRTESMQGSHGTIIDSLGVHHVTAGPSPETGSIIHDRGNARYIENILWDGLSKELPEPPLGPSTNSTRTIESTVNTSSSSTYNLGERLVFDRTGDCTSVIAHPTPIRAFWLWQTFLNNVNPIVKILHVPTAQQIVLRSASDSDELPPSEQSLMFAIYLSAMNSIPRCDLDNCTKTMGEPLPSLIQRYTEYAQQALIHAQFMRSFNFTTLQGFVLFLVAIRGRTDPQTLWMLTGLAIRNAQRLGIHREKALQNHSIFEAELRRRSWWEILLLESHAAKFCGVASHTGPGLMWDTRRPLNINDSDLHPQMHEPPKEILGTTDMALCSARFQIGEFTIAKSSPNQELESIAQVDAEVATLKQHLEDRLLQFCDPAIPIHFMTLLLGRAALGRVKLTIRRRHMQLSTGSMLSLEERNKTFDLCLDLIKIPTEYTEYPSAQRFLWQANVFFPIDALMFVLSELAYRKREDRLPDDVAERTWTQIEKAYDQQPRFLHDRENPIYEALRNLTVKAWEKTAAHRDVETEMPQFIMELERNNTQPSAPLTPASASAIYTDPTGAPHDIVAETESRIDDLDPFNMTSELYGQEDPSFWQYWQNFIADTTGSTADQSDPSAGLKMPAG